MLMLQSIFNLDSFPLFFSFPFMAAVGTVGLVWLGGNYLYHSHSCPATRIPMKDASTQTECVTHDINENAHVAFSIALSPCSPHMNDSFMYANERLMICMREDRGNE